ncbi:Fatty acid synthase [Halotydeus destructor]|nr:Fatty acid synthase [Halotydeus destructor]
MVQDNKPDLVISGISGRYPMCDDLEQLKEKLFAGVDMVTADDERWPVGYVRLPTRNGKVYSMGKFDREFFDVSEEEEKYIDPQERLLLETTYEALMDAGIDAKSLKGSNTGYFHGACFVEKNSCFDNPQEVPAHHSRLVNLVPRFFGLRGPILDVDTACGSGLSAFAEAYHAVKNGQCNMAIASSSNTCFRSRFSVQFRDLKMITKDGKCKGLDRSADGYVRSEAIVVTIIQRCEEAKRIYCHLLACLSNSDGYKDEGITFPSIKGQTQLLRDTYQEAGIDPAQIDYIEAHITGTKAGDPVETNVIYDVICKNKNNPLLVGCLKSNIGHTEGASGLCAISKAIIVYQTGLIPPNIHCSNPNTDLPGLHDGKMVPVVKVTKFPGQYIPVNCFGFGGANTHLLTRAPATALQTSCDADICDPCPRLIHVCGRTHEAVNHFVKSLQGKEAYLTRQFLSLVSDFAKSNTDSGMNYRCSIIVQKDLKGRHFFRKSGNSHVDKSSTKQTAIEFTNENILASPTLFKSFPLVTANFNEMIEFAEQSGTASASVTKLATQLALFDFLKQLGVSFDHFYGHGLGVLVAAYADGCLTAHEALQCAQMFDSVPYTSLLASLETIITKARHRSSKLLSHIFSSDSKLVTASHLAAALLETAESQSNLAPNSLLLRVSPGGIKLQHDNNQEQDQVQQILNVVSELYTLAGQCPNIDLLYPSVSYPLPLSTPFLSPLIKWDHKRDAHMEGYLMQKYGLISGFQTAKNIVFRFEQSKSDWAFLYDHKIDGRILFPAAGYLMITWVALSKILNLPVNEMSIRFEQVKFLRATVLSEDSETALDVRINQDTGVFEINEQDHLIVRGSVFIDNLDEISELYESRVSQQNNGNLILDASDLYKELRVCGYDYGKYFQGLHCASSDMTKASVIWRQVMQKTVLDSMTNETDEEQALLWVKAWVPFVDSMFQLKLLQVYNDSRCLMVPTSLDMVSCNPIILNQAIRSATKHLDQVTMNEMALVPTFCDHDASLTVCNGVIVKGFKASFLQRKKQQVRISRYGFVPMNEPGILYDNNRYEVYAKRVVDAVNGHFAATESLDLKDIKFSLLNRIISSENNNEGGNGAFNCKLKDDLFIGATTNRATFELGHVLKTVLDMCICNLVSTPSKCNIDILEVSSTAFFTQPLMSDILSDNLLSNQFKVKYSLLTSKPEEIDEAEKKGFSDIVSWNSDQLETMALPRSNIMMYHYDASKDNKELLPKLAASLQESGFMLMSVAAKPKSKVMNGVLNKYLDLVDLEEVKVSAVKSGLLLISEKVITPSLPFALLVFKKKSSEPENSEKVQIAIGLDDYSTWLEPLKQLLNEGQSTVWLTPKTSNLRKQTPVSGLLGFVKSLRLEANGNKVRLLYDGAASCQVDVNDSKYAEVTERDLVYNIRAEEGEGWGTFEHVLACEDIEAEPEVKTSTDHVYLRSLKPGDLTSLTWVKNNVPSSHESMNSHISIHYAPLNFKDILFATGRLPLDAVPANVSPLISQDSLLGLEFSGISSQGQRVMGIAPYKALASSFPVTDREKDFIWSVPDSWSLEEASTVPVVYATALYALLIRGNMTKGETVLIHAGAGGVGLAAINVALAKGCHVFTTVGSQVKRDFLLKHFDGHLKDDAIFNSRSCDFEDDILRATNGRGVDIVLNSLSDEKLQASLRCLADNGRFLEIGKVDFISDRPLIASVTLDNNKSMHGVFLDTLSQYTDNDYFSHKIKLEKSQLRELISEGLQLGFIKPLPRTVFHRDEVETAFRYMATGKHIGKVIIKMRDQVSPSPSIRAIKTTFLNPNKAYLVVGGSGGLGLELVQWLAQKGAKNIIISSRRGLSSKYQMFVAQRLKMKKVKLVVSQCDVTTEDGARTLLESCMSHAPEGLGGIFNSAVVYKDCLFADQTVDMFEQVCAPKAQATIHLDKISRQLCPNLEYFVTFSSISAGRGNEGQTNYNFANSVMDSICYLRSLDKLAGLSVQWGVIGDVGLVAELHSGEGKSSASEVVLLGSASQRVHSVFETFDRLLNSESSIMSSIVKPSILVGSGTEGAADLLKLISNIVGLKDISILEHSISLGALGIDSLIAVEIKQVIERVLGVALDLKEVRQLTIERIIQLSKGEA